MLGAGCRKESGFGVGGENAPGALKNVWFRHRDPGIDIRGIRENCGKIAEIVHFENLSTAGGDSEKFVTLQHYCRPPKITNLSLLVLFSVVLLSKKKPLWFSNPHLK